MSGHHDDLPDLRLLDPSRHPERWEAMVGGIAAAAAPELTRRAQAADLGLDGFLGLLSGWARPAIAVAAALAAVAATVLALTASDPGLAPAPGIAHGLGYPEPVALWVETGQPPSVEELLASLEGGER
jgi:hypothetical protein